MTTNYTLRSEQVRSNLLEYIRNLPLEPVMRISIKRHVNSKTEHQRGWFHKLCAMWGEELGMQAGDMKEIAKAKLFG